MACSPCKTMVAAGGFIGVSHTDLSTWKPSKTINLFNSLLRDGFYPQYFALEVLCRLISKCKTVLVVADIP